MPFGEVRPKDYGAWDTEKDDWYRQVSVGPATYVSYKIGQQLVETTDSNGSFPQSEIHRSLDCCSSPASRLTSVTTT